MIRLTFAGYDITHWPGWAIALLFVASGVVIFAVLIGSLMVIDRFSPAGGDCQPRHAPVCTPRT
jgi:hypothetical protein